MLLDPYQTSDTANLLQGTDGEDILHGTLFDDDITGLGGSDDLYGDAGDDVLFSGAGTDVLSGGPGNDRLVGEAGVNFLFGDEGDDVFWAIGGVNYILDLGQSDTLALTETSHAFVGPADAGTVLFSDLGFDRLHSFMDSTGRTWIGSREFEPVWSSSGEFLFTQSTAGVLLSEGAAMLTITDRTGESVFASAFMFSGPGSDTLVGSTGDDYQAGGDGFDFLLSSAGADTLDGGADIDIVSYYGSENGVAVALDGLADNTGGAIGDVLIDIEGLYGSQADDTLVGGTGDNILEGKSGNDLILGGSDVALADLQKALTPSAEAWLLQKLGIPVQDAPPEVPGASSAVVDPDPILLEDGGLGIFIA